MSNGHDRPSEDDAIARLLRSAGERDQPDAAIADQVRLAVEAEWRNLVNAAAGAASPRPPQPGGHALAV
jgi:hypothetical protein